MIDATQSILLTDLYQLTMLQGYWQQGMEDIAVFEFFVRKLPKQRGFLIAAGLEQTLDDEGEHGRFPAACRSADGESGCHIALR